jgi:hypothetical protein
MATGGALVQMPPIAAVRQRSIATSTFRCIQVNQAGGVSVKWWAAAAMMSASSRSGRLIYWLFFGFGTGLRVSESSGLAAALRCRAERWR